VDVQELRAQRRKMAHRRRRIIMNDDGLGFRPVPLQEPGSPISVEEFLARRTAGLAGTLVDTISFCVVNHAFGVGMHRSKVCDVLRRDRLGVIPAPGGWDDAGVLLEGRDCLEIVIDFCRGRDIEIWASIRMNATRDLWPLRERTPWNGERPERRLGRALDMGEGLEEKAFLISEGALEHPGRWIARGSCGVREGILRRIPRGGLRAPGRPGPDVRDTGGYLRAV